MSQVEWYGEPDMAYGATGTRDVLLIVSKLSPTQNPDIVPRRPRGPLTRMERRKLEKQGIHRDCCCNDLSIVTARYALAKNLTIVEVLSAEKTTCKGITSRITGLMDTTNKGGNLCVLY